MPGMVHLKNFYKINYFPDIPKYCGTSAAHQLRSRSRRRLKEEEQVQPVNASLRVQVQRHHDG